MQMSESDKIVFVKSMMDKQYANVVDNEMVSAQLRAARMAILAKRYSAFQEIPESVDFPHKYDVYQCQLAVRYINRMGIEGQTAHESNGTTRTYASPDDEDILKKVLPIVRCLD